MANSKQAKKRVRQAEKRRSHNASLKSEMRTYLKSVVKAIETGNKDSASTIYHVAVSTLDKLVSKKVITKNKAARHKSRLNSRIKAIV